MSDEYTPEELDEDDVEQNGEATEGGFGSMLVDLSNDVVRKQLRGMFQSWYIDYASYTILDRAIPHIADGLKPVQRRILHVMKKLDDDRMIKVANIVGATMAYHPHGDSSIYGALVALGQKNLLVETQGNWGNILTGDSAAAGRYIEARLSQFALDVLYNPKVTDWTPSYDGRSKEPVTLPAKFPLLLAQGVGGIAAGLSSLILPHNFNDLLDAAVAYLKGESFELYPDFPTGGFIDVSRYNDGARGGRVRVRAKIEKVDNKTLAITEIPFGMTTASIKESIVKANEKGTIKIRSVEDFTSRDARIIVNLQPGTSSDKAIDALYAFTACEQPISPNCCVICDDKPVFLGVSDVLKYNVDSTLRIFEAELKIQLGEVNEQLFFASLERIFIEERIYKDKEYEESGSKAAAIAHIAKRLEPWRPKLIRDITDEDIARLLEIKMSRIARFSSKSADEAIAAYMARIEDIKNNLANLTQYTIDWFERLKAKYGAEYPRRTVIRSFDNITAATVAEANAKLYYDAEEGFIGTALKQGEFLFNCSELDDVVIFYKDGRYKVVRVQEKLDVGKNVLKVKEKVDVGDGVMKMRDVPQIFLFKRNDERTTYNVIYLNGDDKIYYMKRFHLTGLTRDHEYNLTKGEGSKVMWFSANPNGEAEIVRVVLKPKPRLKTLQFDVDFSTLKPKGRGSLGNIVTKNEVHRFTLKEKGQSTLGGVQVWFDPDVLRLNTEGRGNLLGEFGPGDRVLVILKNGEYYTSTFDTSNHYEDNILRIERFRPGHVWTAILRDADQDGYPYLKRFAFEDNSRKQRYLGENEKSELLVLSDATGARFEVTFGGIDSMRPPLEIDAADFVAVKSFRAKGKRLTTFQIDTINELEPVPGAEAEEEPSEQPEANEASEVTDQTEPEISDDELRDELTGQQRIF